MKSPKNQICVGTLALASVVALLSCGCENKPTGPVQYESGGIVTFNGDPVSDAQVMFYAPPFSRGAITGNDGRFTVKAGVGDGLPAGDYQVAIRPAPGGDLDPIDYDRTDIPKKYWKKETSGLKKTIVEGLNHFHFEL